MIGGEFEIQAMPRLTGQAPLPGASASGRTALYQLLRQLGCCRRVWLPDYLCPTVSQAVDKAGYCRRYYSLTETLSPNLDTIGASGDDIILVVNYFGMTDCRPVILSLRDAFPGVLILEDDVQAWYAFDAGTEADYAFTSLRKTFAVPDGGLIRRRDGTSLSLDLPEENHFAALKIEGAMQKARRSPDTDDRIYLRMLEAAEQQIDDAYETAMSAAGQRLWTAVDTAEVARRRRSNALQLTEGLRRIGIEPLLTPAEDEVPLFLPIRTARRDELRRHLFANEVYCPIHWPATSGNPYPAGDLDGQELSLIVDQRYGAADMDRMLNLIDELL